MDKRGKLYCEEHVFQFYLDKQNSPIHKQILHLHNVGILFRKHPHYLCERQPPNPTSDENEDELIPCLYDSRISYERVSGTNVPVLVYDIFTLHHPFSMLVAGPRGAGKSEFVKQLLSLKRYVMTDPPERIVWFYGRHQPDLFCSLTQEIPSIEFYEALPTNIEVMFHRSKRNICIIDGLMQSASGNQLVENLFTNGRHLNLLVVSSVKTYFIQERNAEPSL